MNSRCCRPPDVRLLGHHHERPEMTEIRRHAPSIPQPRARLPRAGSTPLEAAALCRGFRASRAGAALARRTTSRWSTTATSRASGAGPRAAGLDRHRGSVRVVLYAQQRALSNTLKQISNIDMSTYCFGPFRGNRRHPGRQPAQLNVLLAARRSPGAHPRQSRVLRYRSEARRRRRARFLIPPAHRWCPKRVVPPSCCAPTRVGDPLIVKTRKCLGQVGEYPHTGRPNLLRREETTPRADRRSC